LCAFDLIELDGKDLRWARLEDRTKALADLPGNSHTTPPVVSGHIIIELVLNF
jgi:ATP-dependent DNA ligase